MPRKEDKDRVSLNKSSRAITFVLIGPALLIGGCRRPWPQATTQPHPLAGQPLASLRCPKCGEMNTAARTTCIKCGAALPAASTSRSGSGYRGGGGYGGGGFRSGGGGSAPGGGHASPAGGFGSTGSPAGA